MENKENPRSASDYRIGWICALECELTAARAVLDEEHPRLPKSAGDTNVYTLGAVHTENQSLNIVIAALPIGEYGTASAAVACTELRRTFPNLAFGLMVGIAGGAPKITNDPQTSTDIRLGDVVVGVPSPNQPAIFQYDLGKAHHAERRPRPSHNLNNPPRVLLNAVTTLKSRYRSEPRSILDIAESILERRQHLRSEFERKASRLDSLYDASHQHVGSDLTCESCDVERKLNRPQRVEQRPLVFHGTIASGNQIIRDPITRDYWRDKFGVLCFEMESAGVVNYLPCLVIRGICDYSDSHKNKVWQGYAAITAAAYAKDVLLQLGPDDLCSSTSVKASKSSTFSQLDRCIEKPKDHSAGNQFEQLLATFWFRGLDWRFESVEDAYSGTFEWLFHYNESRTTALSNRYSESYSSESYSSESSLKNEGMFAYKYSHEYRSKLQRGVQNPEWDPCGIVKWLRNGDGIYFISGKPGCGKSTLMKNMAKEPLCSSMLMRWAGSKCLSNPHVFFWRAGSDMQKTQHYMLQSILYQIFKGFPELMSKIIEPSEAENAINRQQDRGDNKHPLWNLVELSSLLRKISSVQNIRICLFVDGLDEFEGSQSYIADFLRELSLSENFKILVAARPLVEYVEPFRGCPNMILHEWTHQDIEAYASRLILNSEQIYGTDLPLRINIEAIVFELRNRADGVFLWVKSALSLIMEGMNYGDSTQELRARLRELPQDLYDLYADMLTRLNKRYVGQAKFLLALILHLQKSENVVKVATVALASEYAIKDENFLIHCWNRTREEMQSLFKMYSQRIRSRCSGFISVVEEPRGGNDRLEVMHRTVIDFCATSMMQDWLNDTDMSQEDIELRSAMGSIAARVVSYQRGGNLTPQMDFYPFQQVEIDFLHISARNFSDTARRVLNTLEKLVAHWQTKDPSYMPRLIQMDVIPSKPVHETDWLLDQFEAYCRAQFWKDYYPSRPTLALMCVFDHRMTAGILWSLWEGVAGEIDSKTKIDLLTYLSTRYIRQIVYRGSVSQLRLALRVNC